MRDRHAAEVKTLTQHLGAHKESMVFARLADRYLHLNEVQKAIDLCHSGLRNHPQYASAYYVLAKCHLALNQFEEAEKNLKRLLNQDPRHINGHRLYSELMAKMGLSLRQRDSLAKIHELDPFYPLAESEPFARPESAPAARTIPLDEWTLPPVIEAEPAAAAEPFAPPVPEPPAPAPAYFEPEARADAAAEPLPPVAEPEAPAEISRPEPLVSDYKPPVPELDLEAFTRELAALEVPADEELGGKPAGIAGTVEPIAETAETMREPENDFEREEMHFSEILDDLFSLSRDEETRRELEERSTIERAALRPEPELGPPVPEAEEFLPEEEPPSVPAPEPEARFTPESEPEYRFEPEPEPPAVVEPEPEAHFIPEPEPEPESEPDQSPASLEEPLSPPEALPGERRMAPVLPFRGDEEWTEEPVFEAPAEPETPIRLEPPAEGFGDEAADQPLSEEEEEEQFASFLSNLDRLGGADLEPEEEEKENLLTPAAKKGFTPPWEEEPEEEPAQEPLVQAEPEKREAPRRMVQPPAPEEEVPAQEEPVSDKPKEKFVTPTLGEIYAAQGQYAKAINVFEMLLKKNPENEWYRTKLEYLRKRLEDESK
ncbi:MAG TPA: tetratricopeptide repeat protein [bacterium]|nr:tetratricopeptide repeat protein [bacterium]